MCCNYGTDQKTGNRNIVNGRRNIVNENQLYLFWGFFVIVSKYIPLTCLNRPSNRTKICIHNSIPPKHTLRLKELHMFHR